MTDDVHVPRLRRTTRFPFLIVFVLAFMIGCEYFFSISHTVHATFRDATEGKSLDRVDHDDESIAPLAPLFQLFATKVVQYGNE
jgi:hypothetical protein